MRALFQFACHDENLCLKSFWGRRALLSVFGKQPSCSFVFLPVSEPFSGSAAALSGDTENKEVPDTVTAFGFKLEPWALLIIPSSMKGVIYACRGGKKKASCWHMWLSLREPHCRGKMPFGHLEQRGRCTMAKKHDDAWACSHIMRQVFFYALLALNVFHKVSFSQKEKVQSDISQSRRICWLNTFFSKCTLIFKVVQSRLLTFHKKCPLQKKILSLLRNYMFSTLVKMGNSFGASVES